ncbi:MAG: Signal transduction histidine kinase containing PAS domain [Candidatus Methanohalarchaeum thermophilum]|uniref:histidine kinase n=1 Tax=Methanohalarchaeum thermophilum TaxID=1903181 RepID=A0A1Q6DSD5_METT1|nr:MAG: Signal transduction histidine kinase containing PAS domain [Candidatus Methanohalarchaeum thermophilum]
MIDVLIVDDEKSFLELTKTYLEKEDDRLDVDTYSSPVDAFDCVKKGDYDCVVCDYQMPEMNGIELLRKIREDLDSDLPFIVFTGKSREEIAIDALNYGADRYIQKGGEPKSQFSVLAKAIKQESEYYKTKERLELTNFSLQNASIGALWISPGGVIRYANKEICSNLGYDRSELVGKTVGEINPEYSRDRPDIWSELKDEGEIVFRTKHVTKDGDIYPVEVHSHYLKRDGKEYEFAFTQDISDIKEKKEMFQEMLDGLPDVVGFQKPDHTIIRYNQTGYDLLDVSPEEARGTKCYRLLGREVECEECATKKALKSKDVECLEKYQSELDMHLKITANPVLDEQEEVKYIIEHLHDISDRKEAEEEIKKTKRRYQNLFEKAGDGVAVISLEDGHGEILESNETFADMLGYGREELIGKDVHDFIVKEDDLMGKEMHEEKLKKGETVRFNEKKETKGGREIWTEVVATPIDYNDQKAVLGINRDITQEKDRKQKLKGYRRVVDRSDHSIAVINKKREFVFANPQYREFLGLNEKERLEGRKLDDFFEERKNRDIKERIKKCFNGERIQYETTITKNKEEKSFEVRFYPITNDNKTKKSVMILTDITERKKAEKDLKEAKNILEKSPVITFSWKNEKGWPAEFVSSNVDNIFGYTKNEFKSNKILYKDLIHPSDRERVQKEVKEASKKGKKEFTHKPYRVKTKNGDTRIVRDWTSIERDSDGKIRRYKGIIRDITKQKKAEEKEKFLHSLLRHDLSNKIQVIKGYLELLQEEPEQKPEHIKKALKTCKSSEDIIEKVRTLRKIEEEEENKEININNILKDAIEKNQDLAKEKNIKLQKNYPKKIHRVKGGKLLKELFNNLIENAIKHSKGNKIQINCKTRENKVICSIEDDGKGIPDKKKKKIFHKGYKHGETAGTGLGLYLAKEITKNYNGKIEVKDSKLGGTKFNVYLKKA